MSSYTYVWVACSIVEFGDIGKQRHLIREGQLTTVCGHSASHAVIWRKDSRKPKCHVCEGSKVNR